MALVLKKIESKHQFYLFHRHKILNLNNSKNTPLKIFKLILVIVYAFYKKLRWENDSISVKKIVIFYFF